MLPSPPSAMGSLTTSHFKCSSMDPARISVTSCDVILPLKLSGITITFCIIKSSFPAHNFIISFSGASGYVFFPYAPLRSFSHPFHCLLGHLHALFPLMPRSAKFSGHHSIFLFSGAPAPKPSSDLNVFGAPQHIFLSGAPDLRKHSRWS